MNTRRACTAAVGLLLGTTILITAALAQKQGGVLRVLHRDSPASMSILEEGSISLLVGPETLAKGRGMTEDGRVARNDRVAV